MDGSCSGGRQTGGVYDREVTLRANIALSEEELAGHGTSGVATWSKLLAIQSPERFAIFDARVSVAFDALQVVQDHERAIPKSAEQEQNCWGIPRLDEEPRSERHTRPIQLEPIASI